MFADFMNMEFKRLESTRTEETTYFGKRVKRVFLKEQEVRINIEDISVEDRDVIIYRELLKVVD